MPENDKKTKPIDKAIERPFFGSQEKPMHESVSAPANTNSSITTGKPRPKTD